MSLQVFTDLTQGSEDWYEQRRGILTASVVGRLITPKTVKVADNMATRALTATLVAERVSEHVEPTFVSDDMELGHLIEPLARSLYAEHFGAPVTEVGFMVRDDLGFKIGYSPDGLVGSDGLIEIKSRRPKEHLTTIVSDEVPAENMAQIQCGLWVAGRQWCDYLSYSGGMPMWRKRVTPDPTWQEAIVAAATAFEKAANEMTDKYLRAVVGLPMTERITWGEVELKLS